MDEEIKAFLEDCYENIGRQQICGHIEATSQEGENNYSEIIEQLNILQQTQEIDRLQDEQHLSKSLAVLSNNTEAPILTNKDEDDIRKGDRFGKTQAKGSFFRNNYSRAARSHLILACNIAKS